MRTQSLTTTPPHTQNLQIHCPVGKRRGPKKMQGAENTTGSKRKGAEGNQGEPWYLFRYQKKNHTNNNLLRLCPVGCTTSHGTRSFTRSHTHACVHPLLPLHTEESIYIITRYHCSRSPRLAVIYIPKVIVRPT